MQVLSEVFNSAGFLFLLHLVIIGVFVFFFGKVSRKKNQLLRENIKLKQSENRSSADGNNDLMKILTHDLKNPISALKGSAMLIQNDPEDVDSVKELSKMIVEAADEVTNRLGQFLNMQEIDDVEYQMNRRRVNIGKLLEKIVEINKPQAEAKKQLLIYKKSGETDFIIDADEQKLMAAFDNIINNAIKYSPFEKEINVNLERKKGKILIEIKDEGPGFSDKDLQQVFGKFKRLSARPTGGEVSSGLGLFIVKRIIELHNGKVWIKSEKGMGSSFYIEI